MIMIAYKMSGFSIEKISCKFVINKMYSKLLALFSSVAVASCHMRMLDPPGRTSLWRFPEYEHLNPEVIDTDDQMWCDNIRQFENDNRCGVCGDPVDQQTPRFSEYQGRYWRDVKVRTYRSGDVSVSSLKYIIISN